MRMLCEWDLWVFVIDAKYSVGEFFRKPLETREQLINMRCPKMYERCGQWEN